ncbi:MAG TPA: phosphoribosylanthranilate isomerase [Arenimonas sp.]|uniref:phosphoribosylanthranilate isomerase n=1 Tax=Arenimonas sp. TaxID=1872635 RepID=UPI002C0F8A55|nr:phosphoribosylanthranilate isomerase [Arenimonas sp.]HMB55643.1 phosphoribosylanthranilate isomerase [Arenimonas sp.]
MRTRIKFCGLTRPGDVRLAVELGVDALGFVFATGSPRFVTPELLPGLRSAVSPLVDVVALFMDASGAAVVEVVRALRPSLLQFHGREDDAFCRSFGLPFIKTLTMGPGSEDAQTARKRYPSASALLLDGHAPGQQGGRGESFDWGLVPNLGRPIFLAGGLDAGNVGTAIRQARPYAVDVSSGIESSPGLKDGDKMQQFVDEVRRADRQQFETSQGHE